MYDRYRSASARLAIEEPQYDLSDSNQISNLSTSNDSTYRSAELELKKTIEEIRNVSGFADFLRPWSFGDIATSLYGNTLVYLLVAPVGGLILVVHKGEVKPIWLNINDQELRSILIESQAAQGAEGYLSAQLGRAPIRPSLDEILPWIGERMVKPLAQVLRGLKISKIVLIPIGRVALLPIHAAIYSNHKTERRFLDEFTVSYVPSARALFHSVEITKAISHVEHDLLAIGNPQPLPAEIPSIPYSRNEIEEIAKLFNGNVNVLFEEKATHSAVINALDGANHIHFACHATFEPESPLDSGLLLSNKKRLTLSDLLSLGGLHKARLVTLSACQTAIVDFDKLPEESIGLPGCFLQSGVPGVIGSLWPVDDISTAFLMVRFYQIYLSGVSPEEALRHAQIWLRDVKKNELLDSESLLTVHLLKLISKRLAFEDDETRPFAHPYYWAGFIFHGA